MLTVQQFRDVFSKIPSATQWGPRTFIIWNDIMFRYEMYDLKIYDESKGKISVLRKRRSIDHWETSSLEKEWELIPKDLQEVLAYHLDMFK
jgi:hypothetical protein